MPGGRRLWESKDDQAWVHDRFEEMNLQDRRYEVIIMIIVLLFLFYLYIEDGVSHLI